MYFPLDEEDAFIQMRVCQRLVAAHPSVENAVSSDLGPHSAKLLHSNTTFCSQVLMLCSHWIFTFKLGFNIYSWPAVDIR